MIYTDIKKTPAYKAGKKARHSGLKYTDNPFREPKILSPLSGDPYSLWAEGWTAVEHWYRTTNPTSIRDAKTKRKVMQYALEAKSNPAMFTMPFGKYAGAFMGEIPRDYLEWLVKAPEVKFPVWRAAYLTLHPKVDLCKRATKLIKLHADAYRGFDTKRFVAAAKRRYKKEWAMKVIKEGVSKLNKSFRAERSIKRYADSQD